MGCHIQPGAVVAMRAALLEEVVPEVPMLLGCGITAAFICLCIPKT